MVSILVPLYIYPTDGWPLLTSMASQYPNTSFTCIVNPDSGPGATALPDENYISALSDLSSYDNIDLIGYVSYAYGERSLDEVLSDITTYTGWEPILDALDEGYVSLSGIFIDEVPTDTTEVERVARVSDYIHDRWEKALDKCATVVYNPGTQVDPAFYESADYVVSFENTREHWRDYMDNTLANLPPEVREKSAVIVHTYDGSDKETMELAGEVAGSGAWGMYLTHQGGALYDQWPAMFEEMVESAAAQNHY